ncbi:MAG: hypothetical protein IKT26_05525 [Bacteroidaceae bacterium]|nr:hypothetical protein [Bacteroidaceae bacterium]
MHKRLCQKSIATSIFATECQNVANSGIWSSGKFFVNSSHKGRSTACASSFFVPPPLSKASEAAFFASTAEFSGSTGENFGGFANFSAALIRNVPPKQKTSARRADFFTLN